MFRGEKGLRRMKEMNGTMSVEEYKQKSREYEAAEARKGMIAHAAITVVVSTVLVTVNLVLVPEFLWSIFPLVGMSIGLGMHYLFGVRLMDRFAADRERRIDEWR
jgi:hypothetical protein